MVSKLAILFGIVIVLIIYLIPSVVHYENELDRACQDLGFKTQSYKMQMQYCEDTEGNLYYVKFDCKNWFWQECTGKLISIGKARTT